MKKPTGPALIDVSFRVIHPTKSREWVVPVVIVTVLISLIAGSIWASNYADFKGGKAYTNEEVKELTAICQKANMATRVGILGAEWGGTTKQIRCQDSNNVLYRPSEVE